MNRKRLIEALQAQGYKGALTLDAAKAYFGTLLASGIIFSSGGKNLDEAGFEAAWAKTATVTLTDPDEEDETEPGETGGKAGTDPDQATLDAAERIRHKRAKALRGGDTSVGEVTRKAGEGPQTFSIGNHDRKAFAVKIAQGKTHIQDVDTAEACGAYLRLLGCKTDAYAKRQSDLECLEYHFGKEARKAATSYEFAGGGFAVAAELVQATMINIRAKYNLINELGIRQNVAAVPSSIPRRTGGIVVTSRSEGVAQSEATRPTGDRVRMAPFSINCLAKISRVELAKSVVDYGNFVLGEMRYAADSKLENILILGDGTSTYFNQRGLYGKIDQDVVGAGGTTITNWAYAGCLQVADGATWASITYPNVMGMLGKILLAEQVGPIQIVCSQQFYMTVLDPLATGRGGSTSTEVVNGIPRTWKGWPIAFSNAMPTLSAASSIAAYAGDWANGIKIGDVPELSSIGSSSERYWDEGNIGYQLEQWHALTVHDTGTAHATAASRTLGPIAGLVTTA